MNYSEARPHIKDGDIVQVRTAHSLFGYATKFFTGVYTHTGIAVWLDGGLWLVEINGGRNHLIPLSQLAGMEFDVYLPPKGVSRAEIRKAALESIRVRVEYGFAAVVAAWVNEFFRINKVIHWRNQLECAGYVVKILVAAGWHNQSFIVSPTKLSTLLVIKLEVRHE